MGRPSEYTDDVAAEICDRIAKGESVQSICHTDAPDRDWVPSERTVYRWLEENISFRQMYVRAREAQADREFDEAKQVATAATPETVQVARLQVDTIKWRAAKLAPKKYGDKIEVEHSGAIDLRAQFLAMS